MKLEKKHWVIIAVVIVVIIIIWYCFFRKKPQPVIIASTPQVRFAKSIDPTTWYSQADENGYSKNWVTEGFPNLESSFVKK